MMPLSAENIFSDRTTRTVATSRQLSLFVAGGLPSRPPSPRCVPPLSCRLSCTRSDQFKLSRSVLKRSLTATRRLQSYSAIRCEPWDSYTCNSQSTRKGVHRKRKRDSRENCGCWCTRLFSFSPSAVTIFMLNGFNEQQDNKRLLGIDCVFRNRDTLCPTAQFHPG